MTEPVRRKSGIKEKIAPWEVTEKYAEDPIIELAAVRPDFNGALVQFLIGLLQTTCAPQGNSDWRKWLNTPPSLEELKNKFDSITFAFNLDGDGPRFMQDLTIEKEDKKTTVEVEKLFIDAPGEQALKQNKDLFNKRDKIRRICYVCCSHVLLTMQINAPAGGAGHRVGLRGGGPVNTVFLGDNLWQTVWHNLLSANEFNNIGNVKKIANEDKFPWMAKTRTSEKDRATTSQDVHPAQVYWSMPRRIRLIFTGDFGKCDLCLKEELLVQEYFTKPYGVKYDGFIHPLTPTYKSNDGTILSVHQHEMMGYKHWMGYVQNTDEGRESARVISNVMNRIRGDFRIWAFGYDMDNMKARGWHEGVIPVIFIEDEQKWKDYSAYVAMLILAASKVSYFLSFGVSKALNPKDRKNKDYNQKLKENTNAKFWQGTEVEFYKQIIILRQAVIEGQDGLNLRQAWQIYLARKAEEIFNDMAQADMIDIANAQRVSKAWNELRKNLYGKLKETLALS